MSSVGVSTKQQHDVPQAGYMTGAEQYAAYRLLRTSRPSEARTCTVANMTCCYLSQGFWQSAIAARPSAAYKGYILGGLLWVGVPFCLATAMGLGALALDLPLSAAEVAEGLVPPAVAYHLLGKGGVAIIITMVGCHARVPVV